MTKPAVLHIITRLDLGGAQKSCLSLIEELQSKHPNFEIYLISGTKGPLVAKANKLKNVNLLDTMRWEIHPRNVFTEIKNFIQLIKIMRQLKKKHPNFTVHTHTIKAGVVGRWAAFFAGVKNRVHTIHGFGFNPYQNKLIWLIFYLIELVTSLITTHFICVSSQDQKAGSEIFPNFNKKSTIIRAATLPKPQSRESKPKASSGPTFGTIACLKTGKNLFELMKAFKMAKYRHEDAKLEIIGSGPLKPHIVAWINENNLQNSIYLLGWIENPISYAQNWDMFVFTSLWEGLPCAIVEASDLKIPIIAYNTGGISDLINISHLHSTGRWLDIAQKMKNLHTPNPKAPHISFYIPKMALDHTILYRQLDPFDNLN